MSRWQVLTSQKCNHVDPKQTLKGWMSLTHYLHLLQSSVLYHYIAVIMKVGMHYVIACISCPFSNGLRMSLNLVKLQKLLGRRRGLSNPQIPSCAQLVPQQSAVLGIQKLTKQGPFYIISQPRTSQKLNLGLVLASACLLIWVSDCFTHKFLAAAPVGWVTVDFGQSTVPGSFCYVMAIQWYLGIHYWSYNACWSLPDSSRCKHSAF